MTPPASPSGPISSDCPAGQDGPAGPSGAGGPEVESGNAAQFLQKTDRIKATAEAWLEERHRAVMQANAALVAQGKRPRHKAPTIATANRDVITPYRATLVHFAHNQKWCEHMVVHGLVSPPGTLPPAPPARTRPS